MAYTLNKKQMDEFLNNIVESFSGKDFTIDDIKWYGYIYETKED